MIATKQGLLPVGTSLLDVPKLSRSNTVFHIIFGIDPKLNVSEINGDCNIGGKDSTGKNNGIVRVVDRGKSRDTKLLKNVRLAQSIKYHQGAIWVAKFSLTGEYLCTAGEDSCVVIWKIGGTPDDLRNSNPISHSQSEAAGNVECLGVSSSFLCPEPYHVFRGHTGDIVDVSWSCTNFILSASVDATVRLWHVTRPDCIHVFRHPDIVTCVDFHPQCDWKFSSGCFDKRVRVWEIIPDPIIRQYCAVREIITAICFSPDGSLVVCGLINGEIASFDATSSRMSLLTRMHCRNNAGKYKLGRKVTGISFLSYRKSDLSEASVAQSPTSTLIRRQEPKTRFDMPELLVTTNDHRIRRMRMEDRSVQVKYKGLSNSKMQIRANTSEDRDYVICGSDDGRVFVWTTEIPKTSSSFFTSNLHRKPVNNLFESFSVNGIDKSSTTVAEFIPANSLIVAASCHPILQSMESYNELLSYLKLCSHTTKLSVQDASVLIAASAEMSPMPNNGVAAAEHDFSTSLFSFLFGKSCRAPASTASGGGNPNELVEEFRAALDTSYNCCSRAILTASSDGVIRLFVRDVE